MTDFLTSLLPTRRLRFYNRRQSVPLITTPEEKSPLPPASEQPINERLPTMASYLADESFQVPFFENNSRYRPIPRPHRCQHHPHRRPNYSPLFGADAAASSRVFISFAITVLIAATLFSQETRAATTTRDEYFMNTPYGMCVPGLVFRVAAQAGEIMTPGYPDEYPPKQDCRWLIDVTDPDRAGRDRVAVLKFVDFRLETLCESERVEIYDGNDLTAPMLAKICGNIDSYDDVKRYGGDGKRSWYNQTMVDLGFVGDDGWSYFASSPVMLVRFVTDNTWSYRGFRALFFGEDMPDFIVRSGLVRIKSTTTTTTTTTKRVTTSTTQAPSTTEYDYGEETTEFITKPKTTTKPTTTTLKTTSKTTTKATTTTEPPTTTEYDYGEETTEAPKPSSTTRKPTSTTTKSTTKPTTKTTTTEPPTTTDYDYGEETTELLTTPKTTTKTTTKASTPKTSTTTQPPSTTEYDYGDETTEMQRVIPQKPTTTAPKKPTETRTLAACYGPSERLPPAAYNMRSTAFQFLVDPTISCDGVIDSVEFVSTQASIDFILLVLRRYHSYDWLRSNQSYWLLAYRNISTANYAIRPFTWTSVNIADPISVNKGDMIGFMYHSIFVNHETAPLIPHAMTNNKSYAGYAELWDWNALTDFILHPDKPTNDSPLKRPLFDLHEVSSLNRPFRMPAIRVRVTQPGSLPRQADDDSNYPMLFMDAPHDPQFLCSAMLLKEHTNSSSRAASSLPEYD